MSDTNTHNDICNSELFEKLYKENIETLRNYLYYKYGDLSEAEDIAQNAFIKLWENCKKITPDKAKSFLYVTANNMSLNVIKHNKIVLKYRSLTKKDITYENPEYQMMSREFQEKIDQALNDLSEKQREVFLMNRIDKLKYKEIAEILGISIKAVEKRMHLALQQLRKKIGNI
jgi:RNA polymerase sigma-70 factor (ECF subfamily)